MRVFAQPCATGNVVIPARVKSGGRYPVLSIAFWIPGQARNDWRRYYSNVSLILRRLNCKYLSEKRLLSYAGVPVIIHEGLPAEAFFLDSPSLFLYCPTTVSCAAGARDGARKAAAEDPTHETCMRAPAGGSRFDKRRRWQAHAQNDTLSGSPARRHGAQKKETRAGHHY